jgi:hypothetical protein
MAYASHSCPTLQPSFAYIDVDNDGCYTAGIDSDGVDAQLQAPVTMTNVPSFVAPPNTGLVIPDFLVLPTNADPFWSVPNDVWIDGRISGPSSLRIEAGGTTYLNGRIRTKGKGVSDGAEVRLGCAAGCGPTVVDDGARLANNGLLALYDAEIGDDVRIKVSCEPGGVPSCGGRSYFARATSIGDRVRLSSAGGIHFDEGTSLLVIGDGVSLTTRSVRTDGATLGFGIVFELNAGVTFGSDTRLRAGGSIDIYGGESLPATGPVSFGPAGELVASGLFVEGSSLDIGAGSVLRGKRDIMVEGRRSTVRLGAANGPLSVSDGAMIGGGRVILDSGAGLLDVGSAVQLMTSGGDEEIALGGRQIVVGPSALLTTTSDVAPIVIAADASVSVSSSSLRGGDLEVSVSDPAATIAFTDNQATGVAGTIATFVAASGGVCDLTGSVFTKVALDTTNCGTVIGP